MALGHTQSKARCQRKKINDLSGDFLSIHTGQLLSNIANLTTNFCHRKGSKIRSVSKLRLSPQVEVDEKKKVQTRKLAFMIFLCPSLPKKANVNEEKNQRNEIKREKLENERSCDMSWTFIMGIWVKNERIITVGLAAALSFCAPPAHKLD